MKNELITVIIPAYNSEKYIKKCLDSVFAQTYKNLEVIVVNDGSKDNTSKIVKSFTGVTLLNKDNGGLCSARNYGVKHAKGKYVVLLDSDDYYEKDFVMNLYTYTTGRTDEVIMCDFLIDGQKESANCQYLEMNSKEQIFNTFLHGGIYNRTVNKIYHIDLIKSVSFPEGRDMLEDAFFTSHILEKCNHAIRISYAGYNYIRHDGTYTRNKLTYKQLSSMHSNILEKDIVLSNHVSGSEYDFLSKKIVVHIKNCLNALIDLERYEIYNKIYKLLVFMNSICLKTKKVKKFTSILIKGTNIKKLKRRYFIYSFFIDGFDNKYLYLRNFVRKIIIKRKRT